MPPIDSIASSSAQRPRTPEAVQSDKGKQAQQPKGPGDNQVRPNSMAQSLESLSRDTSNLRIGNSRNGRANRDTSTGFELLPSTKQRHSESKQALTRTPGSAPDANRLQPSRPSASVAAVSLVTEKKTNPNLVRDLHTIYATNAGSQAINAFSRRHFLGETPNGKLTIDPRDVAREVTRNMETNAPDKSQKETLARVRTLLDRPTKDLAELTSRAFYTPTHYNGQPIAPLFHGRTVTDAILNTLKLANKGADGQKTVVQSAQLLSCDSDLDVATRFANSTPAGEKRAVFTIKEGHSSGKMLGIHPLGEHESIFSPYALFNVTAFEAPTRPGGPYTIELQELPPGSKPPNNAVRF